DFRPNYGESVVRLSTADGLKVADSFTPFEWKQLNNNDADLGSGATMLLPDQPGSKPHLLVEAGKSGKIYLLDRDKLGRARPDAVTEKAAIVQIIETGIKGVC